MGFSLHTFRTMTGLLGLLATLARPANSGAQPPAFLRNPGFEEAAAAGSNPAEWVEFREAYADTSASLARSGRRSVRSSFLYGWYQELGAPCDPFQSFAVQGHAAPEFDFQSARIRVPFFAGDGSFLLDRVGDSPISETRPYGEFWASVEVPEGGSTALLFLLGRFVSDWLRFDDLRLFTESFVGPGSPNGGEWIPAGGATASGGGVFFQQEGDGAQQDVVSNPANTQYFVAARFSSPVPGRLAVREERLSRGERETSQSSESRLVFGAGDSFGFVDLPPVTGTLSSRARVTLTLEEGDGVSLARISRGFARVEPSIHTVGSGSLDKTVIVTAAWPRELSTATVEIVDHHGTVVAPLSVQSHGASLRAAWAGGDVAAGVYRARIRMTSQSGDVVQIERPLEVRRMDTVASVRPVVRRSVSRVAWLYLRYDATPGITEQTIRLARGDGFDVVLAHCRLDQLQVLRRTCERLRLPFIVQLDEVRSVFGDMAGRDTFSEAEFRARVSALLAPVSGSSLFRGAYIVDEPSGARTLDAVRRATLALSRPGAPGPAFFVLPDISLPSDITQTAPAVAMADIYPFATRNPFDNADALLNDMPKMRAYAAAARSIGREYWHTLQGFEAEEGTVYRSIPPALHRAQLAAAIMTGARGVVPFTYTSISYIEGLRGPDLEATSKLSAYREFNRAMDRLGPVIGQLDVPELDTRVPRPIAAGVARHPRLGKVLFLLNCTDQATRQVRVSLAGGNGISPLNLVTGRVLRMGPGAEFGLSMQPGEWAMIVLGRASVSGYRLDPAFPPSLSTLDLPVLSQFTVTDQSGTTQPLRRLQFDDSGDLLAASPFAPAVSPRPVLVYRRDPDGSFSRVPSGVFNGAERTRFSGSTVCVTSPFLGARFFSPTDLTQPFRSWLGQSGGAFDTLVDGPSVWVTMQDYGLRKLTDTGAGLESAGVGLSESESYADLFGPFTDGNVDILLRNTGVNRVRPDALAESGHTTISLNRVRQGGDLNGTGILALPRFQRGVGLLRLSPDGTPSELGSITDGIVEATSCAWVRDDLLAVADGIYNIRFYRVEGGSAPEFVGCWRPPVGGHCYYITLASGGGKLAVGLYDGRVIVAGTHLLP